MPRLPLLKIVAAGLALTVSAAAQGIDGTISGTLGLDEAEWYVVETEGELKSYWREADGALEVHLTGYADRDGGDLDGSLTISFRAAGDATAREARGISVRYRPGGDQPVERGEGESINIKLETVDVAGDDLTISGGVVGRLSPGGSQGRNLSASETTTIDGNFQATVTKRNADDSS